MTCMIEVLQDGFLLYYSNDSVVVFYWVQRLVYTNLDLQGLPPYTARGTKAIVIQWMYSSKMKLLQIIVNKMW